MKKRSIPILLIVTAVVLVVKAVFVQTTSITPLKTAIVSLEAPNKLKRGKPASFQVKVDLSGVTTPTGNQPATLASYVIPIRFDPSALEFVSATSGDSSTLTPARVTTAQIANANGLVTIVGTQTGSEAPTGVVSIASLEFRVVASQKGKTTVEINPELAAPGLSLCSAIRQGTQLELARIPATAQASAVKIK